MADLVRLFEKASINQEGCDLVERETDGWPVRDDFRLSPDEYLGAVILR